MTRQFRISRRFDKLSYLGLCYCRITPEGEYALESHLPACDVAYLPLHRPTSPVTGAKRD